MTIEKLISNTKNLERVLDNFKEGIIAHDLSRRIFFFNREAERITGYNREEILGKDCHEAMGGPFCGEHCSFCSATPTLGEKTDYIANVKTKTGEYKRIEMTVTRMLDEHDELFGVLASFIDLSERLLPENADRLTSFSNIIGQDATMLKVFRQIADVADYDYPVHIYGETGTGKELVATAIHKESYRRNGPFVPINCGALPEGLIESELFGHVKGAFSGAIRDKKGRFELAHGGTIFLDEVVDLSKPLQVKLLRLLQEGTFERVGGEKTRSVNVRVISATNKDLKKEVRQGNFREDLFYRLNVIPIHLPPFRERKDDIPLLIDHFLKEAENRYGREPLSLSREAMELVQAYQWPGNVRELQNVIQFAIVNCRGRVITPGNLPSELRLMAPRTHRRGPSRKLGKEAVRESLKTTGGNKAKAARLLGVGRATLYRFLADHPYLGQDDPN